MASIVKFPPQTTCLSPTFELASQLPVIKPEGKINNNNNNKHSKK